ncbi:MAG TPA: ferritin-like domain-containing protein [Ktedonobacterales bacterium]|nr:ferritin-like domain-containing protein [Ktedonobacterales bacterium]
MGEGSEHAARLLRAYQAQEKRFVERRFPLEFAPEVPALRELYSQSKGLRWNPETDIAWDRFDPSRYDTTTREAASRTWSRRAWSVYPGLTESTALLIRFCLESGSLGMDAKLFLSFRPAEEAKHLEVCHMLAERFGGYEADPGEPGLARISNHPFGQAALDGDVPVEAYIAALGALDDQLDLNLYLSHLQQARDEVVRAALRLIAGDRARHVAFAWAFLGSRVPALDTRGRAAIVAAVSDLLSHVILAGYRNTWLLPEQSREPWLAAEAETARHGLGASTPTQERGVLRATIAQLRERFTAWKLDLPRVDHAELGTV